MARFVHTVTLDAVPRPWFAGLVTAAHDRAQDWLAQADVDLAVTSWDPRTETSGRLTFADKSTDLACTFALRSASSPALFECTGQTLITDDGVHAALREWSWTGRADLERWWQGTGKIGATAHSKLVQGAVGVVPARVDQRQWELTVTTKVRGRRLLRPFAALALLIMHGKLDKKIGEHLDEVARRWHEELPPLLRRDPAEVVDDFARAATESQ